MKQFVTYVNTLSANDASQPHHHLIEYLLSRYNQCNYENYDQHQINYEFETIQVTVVDQSLVNLTCFFSDMCDHGSTKKFDCAVNKN